MDMNGLLGHNMLRSNTPCYPSLSHRINRGHPLWSLPGLGGPLVFPSSQVGKIDLRSTLGWCKIWSPTEVGSWVMKGLNLGLPHWSIFIPIKIAILGRISFSDTPIYHVRFKRYQLQYLRYINWLVIEPLKTMTVSWDDHISCSRLYVAVRL